MELGDENYYKILGIAEDSTEDQVKAAYRKLVLVKHPDKRSDKEQAVKEFQQLQKAYAVLLDDKARKAFDEVLSLQKRRFAFKQARTSAPGWEHTEEQRRKMREKLEEAEERAAKSRGGRGVRGGEDMDIELARRKLQQELDRLRKVKEAQRAGGAGENAVPPEGSGGGSGWGSPSMTSSPAPPPPDSAAASSTSRRPASPAVPSTTMDAIRAIWSRGSSASFAPSSQSYLPQTQTRTQSMLKRREEEIFNRMRAVAGLLQRNCQPL